jgi:hypothetical protein
MLYYAVISVRYILREKNMVMGPADPGPRMTVLVKASSNLPENRSVK